MSNPRHLHFPLTLLAAILSTCVLMLSGSARAQTAAEGWTQFQGGAGHPGLIQDGPGPAFTTAWSYGSPLSGPNDQYGLSTPVVADGQAIALAPDAIVAVSAANGIESWRVPRDEGPPADPAVATAQGSSVVVFTEGWGITPPAGANASASGSGSPVTASPTSSPTTSSPTTSSPTPTSPSPTGAPTPAETPDGSVDAHVAAIGLRDHKRVWTVPLGDVSQTGVTVDGTTAYVGDQTGTVTAIDVTTGKIRWRTDAGLAIQASVAIAGDLVLVVESGDVGQPMAVVALGTSDGKQRWAYRPKTPGLSGGPVAVGDGLGYLGLADATVRAFSLDDGSERWAARLNQETGFTTAPALAPDGLIVVDLNFPAGDPFGGQVYRFDLATGERTWDQALNVPVTFGSPVISGSTVLVPSDDGSLYAVDYASGDLLWHGASGDGGLRGLAWAGGERILAVRDGNDAGLVALDTDPEATIERVVSPTTLSIGTLLLGFAVGVVPVVVVAFYGGGALLRRMGPTELGERDEAEAGEADTDGVHDSDDDLGDDGSEDDRP